MESTGAYHFALFVRFLHVLSGIFWIGLLYFAFGAFFPSI